MDRPCEPYEAYTKMPRRDFSHETVKEALIREGWTITHDPYFFATDPILATDLGAERTIAAERENEKIAVEIKGFRRESQVEDLEQALGQYVLYREALKLQEPDRELYLAVPQHAYDGIFAKQVGKIVVQRFKLLLIVFSLSEKEDLLWKKP